MHTFTSITCKRVAPLLGVLAFGLSNLSSAADDPGAGFEQAQPGEFKKLETTIGVWSPDKGRTIIDDKHARTGKQCLQLTGGKQTRVTLQLAKAADTSGMLTFWAERWTSRAPFSFRIEKNNGKGWQEVFNGDRSVRVGRSFLNHVKVPLGDAGIRQLRFTVNSPPDTGVLIDDLRIAPARPQKIVDVKAAPLTVPALVGAASSPLGKVLIETEGVLNPVSLTEIRGAIQGTGLVTVRLAGLETTPDKDGRFVFKLPKERLMLQEGTNSILVEGTLREDADIDQQVGVAITDLTLSNGKQVKLVGQPTRQRLGIALRKGGDDGVHTYRIPGLATTNKGSLIGVYDVRRRGGGDLPGDIDVGLSRSTDGGRTWEPMKVIMDMGDDPAWRYDGIGDPAVLVDRQTGTIWVAALWSHGNRGWHGSRPGLKPEETGQYVLVRSDDDGVTWSKPINITAQIKKPEWNLMLQGPGKGITLRNGTLVFPAQFRDEKGLPHSTIIYSKDRGKTWQTGTGAFPDTTEAQVVEVEPGVLMLNCRYNRKSLRVVMTTRDMGKTWQKHPSSERALIEPRACMASLIDVDRETGKDAGGWLLFSNPNSTAGRSHITIKASPDRGLTWPKANQLLLDENRSAGYSCMTMIDEKTVGILYEGSQAHMTFQRIPLSELVSPREKGAFFRGNDRGADQPPLDVFVLTGQSNSLGTVDPADAKNPGPASGESDAVLPLFWSNRSTRSGDGPAVLIGDSGGKFVSLRPQQGEGKNPVFWGPEVGFARTLAAAGHKNFAVIKASRGGGGNSYWLKESKDDHMYRHVVQTVREAVHALPEGRAFRIRAVLYVQGESDSESEASASGERLEALLTHLRKDLPNASDARLIVGGIAAAGTRRDVVRREQAEAAERHPAIEYIDNLDLQPQLYDRLHFNRPAKLAIGQRMAKRWLDTDTSPQIVFRQRPIPEGVPLEGHGQNAKMYGYRIPSLLVTSKGSILAFSERRLGLHDHAQNDIVLKRSTDGGKTWSDEIVAFEDGMNSINDPLTVQLESGRILMMFGRFPYGRHARASGWIKMAEHGYDAPKKNILTFICHSDDDGQTWSKPVDISRQVKAPHLLNANTPGAMIQVTKGPHKGRVVTGLWGTLPVTIDGKRTREWQVVAAYSDDHGVTWKRSEPLKDESSKGYPNECQVAEAANGDLVFIARNQGGELFRKKAISRDGGETWGPLNIDETLPSVACMGALIKGPVKKDDSWDLWASFPSIAGRKNGQIMVSKDNGRSWKRVKIIPGPFAYSTLQVSPDKKSLLCLYESDGYKTQTLLTIPFDELDLADAGQASVSGEKRPNILFIVSEDNSDHLGCYGEKRVHTPHLDALAAGGVRYTRAYVPYSVCSPSRAIFLTGLYTRQTGHIGLATHKFSMYRDFKTMPAYFQEAGYYTGFLGKTHVNPERLVEAFIDHRAIKDSNFSKTISIKKYANEARAVMQQAADAGKPFLLIVNYADAHRKFVGKSSNGFPTVMVKDAIAPYPWIGSDTPHLREELRDYLNCMNRLDEGVGMVLRNLDEMNVRDNTLVIYISDHGADFPRGKGSVYENGVRIPMIVNYPGAFPKGKVEEKLVSTIDILPTVLKQAGMPVPKHLPGLALQDIDGGSAERQYIHTFVTGSAPSLHYLQFGIRDPRYKLIWNPYRTTNLLAASRYRNSKLPESQYVREFLHPPEYELYDLEADPHEWKNLATRSDHREIKEGLLAAMKDFQREIKDPFLYEKNLDTFEKEQIAHQKINYRKQKNFRWPHLKLFSEAKRD